MRLKFNSNITVYLLCSLMAAAFFSQSAGAQTLAEQRSITVTGKGFVKLAPDMARINMSVFERDQSIDVARNKTSAITSRVLNVLDNLKVDRKLVDTTGLSVRPDYRWNRTTEEQELQGYIAERRIVVELRDLEQLAALLEGAVAAGVNQVSPPVLDNTQRRDAYRQALVKAVEDARANAEAVASAASTTLGEVLQIGAGSLAQLPRPMMRVQADAMSAEAAEPNYNAGDLRFDATVTATFAIK